MYFTDKTVTSFFQDLFGGKIFIRPRDKEGVLKMIKALKNNLIIWHDLRKDPNDLPEDTYDVLDQAGYKVHYNFFQNVWVNEKDEIDNHVIAWCEVPVFEEEYDA